MVRLCPFFRMRINLSPHSLLSVRRTRRSASFALPATALAFFLAVILAGCANNPYPPGETAEKVQYIAWASDLKTMDPTISYTVNEAAVIDSIYPCFFRYHHLKQVPYELELCLGAAEPKRETFSLTVPDPKTGTPTTTTGEQWTFHIKPGLRFQDDPCFPGSKGRDITAADFAYSWRRMADPHLECPVLSFVQDKVLGMDALVKHNEALSKDKKPADYTYPLPGIVLDPKDPYTFQIRLNQPYPQLRYLMTMHFTTPIAHEAATFYGDEFARHPVGSGSFVMSEYHPKQRIILVKNPNRLAETYPTDGDPGDREAGLLQDAGKPLPLVDKIVFVWTKEAVTSWNLFQQGYLDSVGVGQDNFTQVLQGPGRLTPAMQKRGIRLRTSAIPGTIYFAFNMKDPTWGGETDKGRKLRQAVSLCIDRQQYIDVSLQGLGQAADGLIPPGIFGYEAAYRNPYSRHDVEKAKQLIAEAGYPGGVDPQTGERLTLNVDSAEAGVSGAQDARLLKQWVEAAGIHVDIKVWQSVTWEDRVHKGQSAFFRYGWYADYPDPENFFQLLYGPNIGGVNYAQYNNPEFNHLFEQMRSMNDGPERLIVLNQMRSLMERDSPWILFYYPQGMGISYPWLTNNKPHGVANDGARYTNIDPEMRARFQQSNNRPNYGPLLAFVALTVALSLPAAATATARRNRSVRRRRTETEPLPSLEGHAVPTAIEGGEGQQ